MKTHSTLYENSSVKDKREDVHKRRSWERVENGKMDNGELKMIGNLLVMFVASSSRCFHFPFSIFHYPLFYRDGSVGPRGFPGAPLSAGELFDIFSNSSAFFV